MKRGAGMAGHAGHCIVSAGSFVDISGGTGTLCEYILEVVIKALYGGCICKTVEQIG